MNVGRSEDHGVAGAQGGAAIATRADEFTPQDRPANARDSHAPCLRVGTTGQEGQIHMIPLRQPLNELAKLHIDNAFAEPQSFDVLQLNGRGYRRARRRDLRLLGCSAW